MIKEIYLGVQGEGKWLGKPTVFIRTAGCNIRCKYCDTKYAQTVAGAEDMNAREVAKIADSFRPVNTVCITGGEPLVQKDMRKLVTLLIGLGKKVQLETNGSLDVSEYKDCFISMDVKCPCSGEAESLLPVNFDTVRIGEHQIKFVIADKKDYDYALMAMRDNVLPHTQCVFLPVGGVDLKWLMEQVQKDRLNVMVSPQLHKIVYGNRRRKV